MTAAVALLGLLSLDPFVELPTLVWGIAPKVEADDLPALKRTKDRAVVLIHGLLARPIHPLRAEKPDPHRWQKADAPLVKALAEDADVFGVSYAQTIPMDLIPLSKGLRDGVAALKAAGYKEIVLVGHSAGGVIARRFVECHAESGVTKVVAVAAPFHGSVWAKLPDFIVPKPQVPFIESMAPYLRQQWREKCLSELPKGLQFCCVVCKLPRLAGDTVVAASSQWPEELQKQGISAVAVRCTHFEAMTGEKPIAAIVEVVNGKVKRWDEDEVATARKALFGK